MAEGAQLAPRLQVFFTQTAEAIVRKTIFVQRKSKMTGVLFLQSVVFGFEEQSGACLTDLIETSEGLGVAISKQGLQGRIKGAVSFLQEMFEQGLWLFRRTAPCPAVCAASSPEPRLTRTTRDRVGPTNHPLPRVRTQRQAPEASQHPAEVASSKSVLA